jgi:AbiTii
VLLDELIDELSSQKVPLTETLLKVKVFLRSIAKRELVDWVNNELNGYSDNTPLPPYRIFNCQLFANFANSVGRYQDHPIPLFHLRADQREQLERVEIRDSLSIVEELSQGNFLRRNLPMDYNYILSKGLGSGFQIETAYLQISNAEMKNVQFQARSRLLDFLLDLKESVGDAQTEAELKKEVRRIDALPIFNNAIFGPNATVIVGDHNTSKNEMVVIEGNFNSLEARLKQIGVEAEEVGILKELVDSQEAKIDKVNLIRRVGDWIKDQAIKQMETGARTAVTLSTDAVIHAIRTYVGI